MAVQTGDYDNIPRGSEKLWGWDMVDFKEEDYVRFKYDQFDKVKQPDATSLCQDHQSSQAPLYSQERDFISGKAPLWKKSGNL